MRRFLAEGGGNADDFDVDACVTAADQAEADADEAGCGSEYKSYQKCAVGAECDDATACESEITAYLDCVLGGSETGSES